MRLMKSAFMLGLLSLALVGCSKTELAASFDAPDPVHAEPHRNADRLDPIEPVPATITLTVTNTGDGDLATALTITGDGAASFEQILDAGESALEPGASRELTLAFTPAEAGSGVVTLALEEAAHERD